jgi:hypothetical protein
MRRSVQPPRMIRQPEQPHAAILTAESLHPVKDRLPVVQHAACRIQGERPIRHDTWLVPPLPLIVFHHEHVVSKHSTEGQCLIRRGLLRARSPGDRNLGQRRSLVLRDNTRQYYAFAISVSRPLSWPIRAWPDRAVLSY